MTKQSCVVPVMEWRRTLPPFDMPQDAASRDQEPHHLIKWLSVEVFGPSWPV